jgi:hypothetical protein
VIHQRQGYFRTHIGPTVLKAIRPALLLGGGLFVGFAGIFPYVRLSSPFDEQSHSIMKRTIPLHIKAVHTLVVVCIGHHGERRSR